MFLEVWICGEKQRDVAEGIAFLLGQREKILFLFISL